jgi:uncharacterized glyoxalase superfamily protein PhnB
MIESIDVVFIHTRNPKKLAQWYEEKLEMKISFSTPDYNWQEFTTKHTDEPTRFAIDFPGENASGVGTQSIVISFKVTNLKQAVKELENKGIKFYGTPKIMDTGKTLFSTLRDPEGNWIQLSQRK